MCIVAQTTFNYKKFKDLVEILSKKGYDIIAVNTICNATAERQKEAEELAAVSDAMIVIGGKTVQIPESYLKSVKISVKTLILYRH